jgi:pimeloyl-ACP methyl ester carboxylesterase
VRVELWGHGRSPEPVTLEQYSVEAYLRQFELIRSELDIPRWQLIGQSYGAGLIIRYALTHPDRCESLVVTNSRSAFGVLPPRRRRDPDAPSQDPFDAPGFTLRDLPYHPINARRFPESVKTALVADADAMPVSAVRNGGRLGAGLNCVEALADLTVPMLLTNGVHEKVFQQDVERLIERYPGLELANLEGGHSVNIEAAAAFDEACLAFFDRHARSPVSLL